MLQPKQIKSIVLYADDDPDDRELISNGFVPYGNLIDIKTFTNGVDLLSHVNGLSSLENVPSLIILDINMPLLNGLQTLKLLRQQEEFTSIPIILFTTSVTREDEQFVKMYNAVVLIKPVDNSQFNGIIQAFISHCRKDLQEKEKVQLKIQH